MEENVQPCLAVISQPSSHIFYLFDSHNPSDARLLKRSKLFLQLIRKCCKSCKCNFFPQFCRKHVSKMRAKQLCLYNHLIILKFKNEKCNIQIYIYNKSYKIDMQLFFTDSGLRMFLSCTSRKLRNLRHLRNQSFKIMS